MVSASAATPAAGLAGCLQGGAGGRAPLRPLRPPPATPPLPLLSTRPATRPPLLRRPLNAGPRRGTTRSRASSPCSTRHTPDPHPSNRPRPTAQVQGAVRRDRGQAVALPARLRVQPQEGPGLHPHLGWARLGLHSLHRVIGMRWALEERGAVPRTEQNQGAAPAGSPSAHHRNLSPARRPDGQEHEGQGAGLSLTVPQPCHPLPPPAAPSCQA